MEKKKRRRNKSDWGDDFIAPDGGWGWVICVAGGISNLTIMPMWGSFGLIFRDQLMKINLTTSQITTIVNTQPAMLSCIGLFNGPIFRQFTYRQVAFVAALFIVLGIFLLSTANSFFGYFLAYSILYGIGMGLSLSATFLTLNTYFKEKRRRANSFLLTISGTGPIFWPHVANLLLLQYKAKGVALIFSAIACHALASSLTYQPVKWHTKNKLKIDSTNVCKKCQLILKVPEMTSLVNESTNTKFKLENESKEVRESKTELNNCEKLLEQTTETICKCNDPPLKLKWYQKIIEFFDLDLLKDWKYMNLLIGLTFSAFSEQNFSILVPFFLRDFNFDQNQTAMAMSLMGVGELLVRFLIPFITDRLDWDSRIFYLIGITGMTIGRIFIAQIPKFEVLLLIFGFMGICRALRTVFMGLVIPDYVELKRLPAAGGLQRLSTGIFTLACGPIVGLIQDLTNASFLLYFLSMISSINVILWTVDMLYQSYKNKKNKNIIE